LIFFAFVTTQIVALRRARRVYDTNRSARKKQEAAEAYSMMPGRQAPSRGREIRDTGKSKRNERKQRGKKNPN
jgi:hypothetical protein